MNLSDLTPKELKLRNFFDSNKNLKPGDLYEDCTYHPCKCTSINLEPVIPYIKGISLITGIEQPHEASLNHCGVIPLTQEQVDRKLEAYKKGGIEELIRVSEEILFEIKEAL